MTAPVKVEPWPWPSYRAHHRVPEQDSRDRREWEVESALRVGSEYEAPEAALALLHYIRDDLTDAELVERAEHLVELANHVTDAENEGPDAEFRLAVDEYRDALHVFVTGGA